MSGLLVPMPRFLRVFLLGCIGLTFAYLLLHAREPLRLNLGDPAADANVLTSTRYVAEYGLRETSFGGVVDSGPLTEDSYRDLHDPPLPEILYGTASRYLGIRDIGTFRMLALAFSALAMWLLFQYARRIWSDTIALIATALFTTSLLWMMYADSIDQAPLVQASGFLALWGLVRAIETGLRRHLAAAFLGAAACYLTAYDYWLFLPAAALFTIHSKRGNPFARGTLHFVVICAGGCIAGLLLKALVVGGAVVAESTTLDRRLLSPLSTLLRRDTLVFTPLFWVTIGYTTWRALRAPSPSAALRDGVTWMLVVAVGFMSVFSQLAASQMLGSQVLLPFYAIGSALLIAQLLDGGRLRRAFALGWLAFAPLWSFTIMLTHPRAVLDRDDVAKANAYFAANDRNDFVMTNLMSEGPIQAAFDRHAWAALEMADESKACLKMLDAFEVTGTDYVHAVIFTTPDSRFIDTSLWQLAMHRRLWSLTGWPHLNRRKANQVIGAYDKNVRMNLAAVGAKQVLHLGNFDVYRIDRATVLEISGRRVPVVRTIDFGHLDAHRHELLGWSLPLLTKDGVGVSGIDGYATCPNPAIAHRADEPGRNACKTLPARSGLTLLDEGHTDRAQLLIRVERSCDLRVTVAVAAPAVLALSVGEFTETQCAPVTRGSFVVPQRSVRAGINVLTLDKRLGPIDSRVEVASLVIEPLCGP